jgi:uncharacterized cupin superfamily protein
MNYPLPHTIENCLGEKLTFKEIIHEPDGDKILVENWVKPGSGPVMHTHFKQDESITVKKGKIAYQVMGGETKYAGVGETITFKRGVPHKFWNAGEEELQCSGWVKPANSIVYFLSAIYAAQNKTGSERPDPFDGAYLLTRYKSEYDMNEMPGFVRKVIIPITYQVGKLLGKYKHFKNAPEPLR